MASIVLKNVPAGLHRRLKQVATRNGRSMNREALHLLEDSLSRSVGSISRRLPKPATLRDPRTGKPILMTHAMLMQAIREGRS
jgi:plasmid stability protein